MKAKGLLCAVAFAASIGVSVAQSNVVTNVSVTIHGNFSFNLICNPLNNPISNDITNLFRFASDGDEILRWNSVLQDVDNPPIQISYTLFGWSPHFILNPGEAVFYLNTGPDRTQTFTGTIVQTPYTNPVPFGTIAVRGDIAFNAFGSISPVSTSISNALIGLTPSDGDQICFWNVVTQDIDPVIPTYSAYSRIWDPAINIRPGIGFFYMRSGPSQNQWVRNFTTQ